VPGIEPGPPELVAIPSELSRLHRYALKNNGVLFWTRFHVLLAFIIE
jgi:hypothetical protein